MSNERTCPLCQTSSEILFADARIDAAQLDQFAYASRKRPEYMHLRLLLCKDCDLIYASPVPDLTELHSAYTTAAFDSQIESLYAARTYSSVVQRFLEQLPDRIGSLDIGAGDGAFCRELLSLGFTNVTGLEPSSAPIAAATPEIRNCLRQDMFQPGMFSEQLFSLITCFQTIEHVSEPAELCREAVRLLKPEGALCLVAHNRKAISCKLLGRKSPIFDVEHLQLFSPASLQSLLEKSGLRSVVVRPLYNCYPLAYWTRLFPFPARVKDCLLWTLKTSRLGRIPVSLPAGNLVAWGFR